MNLTSTPSFCTRFRRTKLVLVPRRRTAISTPENVVLLLLAGESHVSTERTLPTGMAAGERRAKRRVREVRGSHCARSWCAAYAMIPREGLFVTGAGGSTAEEEAGAVGGVEKVRTSEEKG